MIKAEQIKTKEDIILILDYLKPYNKMIDDLGFEEDTLEYENACEQIAKYLWEIDEALVGLQQVNTKNLADVDIRMMSYWNYLKGKISEKKLFKTLKKYSNRLLINII